jgi:hypothetical protein
LPNARLKVYCRNRSDDAAQTVNHDEHGVRGGKFGRRVFLSQERHTLAVEGVQRAAPDENQRPQKRRCRQPWEQQQRADPTEQRANSQHQAPSQTVGEHADRRLQNDVPGHEYGYEEQRTPLGKTCMHAEQR